MVKNCTIVHMNNFLILLTALLFAGNGQQVHVNAFQNAPGGYARTRSFLSLTKQCKNRLDNFYLRSSVKNSESKVNESNYGEPMVSDDSNANTSSSDVVKEIDAASKFIWMRQWYPVFPVSFLNELDVDKEPFGITICGEDLVIWKTASGEYSILQDTCPHRRAQLSTGKIISCESTSSMSSSGDETDSANEVSSFLACRYHGWQFDQDGSCVRNPMIPSNVEGGESGFKMTSKAFGVPSYKCQIKGRLLWVFMDPNESEPPAIPADACKFVDDDDAEGDVIFAMALNPISWQSMVENTFDPAHAPFVHEGLSFGGPSYSPDRAIPIETFDLKEQISNAGFTVGHSPYQLPPKSFKSSEPADSEKEEKANSIDSLPLTTRQFLAPATCHTTSIIPNFNSTLYFVPTKAGETMTISLFKTGQSLPSLPGFIPKKISNMLMDFVQYFLFTASDKQYRFLSQDRMIMQAQDKRKTSTSNSASSWEDMYPTTADKGVKVFQKWSKKFGRPSFTMPPTSGEIEGRQLSIWESRAKFSPACIRSIRRFGKIVKVGKRISNLSFIGSLMATFLTLLTNKKREIMLMKSALLLLLSAVTSRCFANKCLTILDKVYVNPTNLAKYQMMDIYAKAE